MSKYAKLLKVSSITLVVLTAVLGGLLLHDGGQGVDKAPVAVQINNIHVGDIAAVAITNKKASYGLLVGEKGISLETKKEGGEYSQEEMQAFIFAMSKLVSTRVIDKYDDISSYGLDKPPSKITIIKRDGSKLRYSLGYKNPVDERYYFAKEGDNRVFLINKADGELMLREETDFWKKDLIPKMDAKNIDLIESISIYSKKKIERAYTIKNTGDYTFGMDTPIRNSISTDKVFSSIILPLSAMHPEKFIENSSDLKKYGLDNPDYRVNLKFDKRDYGYAISKGREDKYYIAKQGERSIYEMSTDKIAFLETDYLDMIGGSIYNCNVSKIKSITFSDMQAGRDYNFELSGEATETKAVINGKTIKYAEFMEFFKLVNSIGMAGEVKSSDAKIKPYFTITINKKNGTIDVLEFLKKDNSESYLKVNGVINFTAFNKSAADIIAAVEKLIE